MWQIILTVLMIMIVLIIIYMTFFIKRILSFFINKKIPRILISVAASVIGIVGGYVLFGNSSIITLLHLYFICLICQFVCYILKKTVKNQHFQKKRELVYKTGIVPILLTAVVISYGYINMITVVEHDYNISSKKIDSGQSLKIAMISDLHMGTTMDVDDLQRHADKISSINPDAFVMVGDIVDENTTKYQMEKTFEILSKIKTRNGVFYTYGNHDRANYSSSPNFTEIELTQNILKNGIKILKDNYIEFDNYIILGREDNSVNYNGSRRKELSEILKYADFKKYVINLDHQPKELQENANLGVDLQLSGHTHGGQVFPAREIAELTGIFELTYGEKVIDNYHAITSSGIASWGYPIRTETQSEFLVININGTKE